MSIIHVNQIKSHLKRQFDGIIDITDAISAQQSQRESLFLTRALAAYAINYLGKIEPAEAAKTVVDGSGDNGLDAIYHHEAENILYVVQSKWIHDGNGEPDNGEIKKFVSGIKDLVNLTFEKFNQKINDLKEQIKQALENPKTRLKIILVYTGINFSELSKRDFESFLEEMNDASEIASVTILNQTQLHQSLMEGAMNEPINLIIGIKEWGKISEPKKGFYGQVNGQEVADWWSKYGNDLFAKNLRELIANSEINAEIEETIENEPDNFWYFNNGITMICEEIEKTAVGGGNNSFGSFECKAISIVNGAQTVGSIGKYQKKNPSSDNLDKVCVPIRIISLESSGNEFRQNITKRNNRQNHIENRDFVALDPQQKRIQGELAIDGITYYIMRSERYSVRKNIYDYDPTRDWFDLVESTTALACAFHDVKYAVQLKREISKLWENIEKPPYINLFNPGVSGLYVWRCVILQRQIDLALMKLRHQLQNREESVAIHGNRVISHLIFKQINLNELKNPSFNFEHFLNEFDIKQKVETVFKHLKFYLDDEYGSNCVIPTLFKNLSKCTNLSEKVLLELDIE